MHVYSSSIKDSFGVGGTLELSVEFNQSFGWEVVVLHTKLSMFGRFICNCFGVNVEV